MNNDRPSENGPASTLSILAGPLTIALILAGCGDAPPPVHDGKHEAKQLLQLLHRIRDAEPATAVAATVHASTRNSTAFHEPLVFILEEPSHDFLDEAIELAAALKLANAREPLVRLVNSTNDELRARAIRAAHAIRPWTAEELTELLQQTNTAVVLAALRVTGNKPFDAVAQHLLSDDTAVRTAAVRALPIEPTRAQTRSLLQLAVDGQDAATEILVRALGGPRLVPTTEAHLDAIVVDVTAAEPKRVTDPADEQGLRLAALTILSTKSSTLARPETVWRAALDDQRSLRERAEAFTCLELTGSFDNSQVLSHLARLPLVLRYYAARCLIRGHDKRGIGILVELLESKQLQRLDQREAVIVRNETRKLLGALASTGGSAALRQWRHWYERIENVPDWIPMPPPRGL